MNKPELLMPAGNIEKMKYAYAFGADAVYLGIPKYSLRARENAFNKESVVEAVQYAHRLGKKIYLTANIIPHNHKVDSFVKYVGEFLKECRPDAWIMSDPGLIMLMQQHFPDQEIHLSVQANTTNYASALFWHKQGVRRLILSRELTLAEIKALHQSCPEIEIEAFVHGSICIAYSGRCLISNYMSYRDPNQGTCSHSCRWEYKIHKKEEIQAGASQQSHEGIAAQAETQQGNPYNYVQGDYYLEETERPGEYMQLDEDENGTYLMNARDLCGIEYLQEMMDAGIDSFKVEGRSKSLYYASLIARAYRRAIDDTIAGRPFNPENWTDIFSTSNRGFIAGFLKGNPGASAQKFDNSQPEKQCYRFAGVLREFDADKKMIRVEPKNPIRKGIELELVSPTDTQKIQVTELYDEDFSAVDEIHAGPKLCCWIPCERNPGEFVILREQMDEFFSGPVDA